MEQNNQQTIQKQSLPIKTKIAAWWMIVFNSFSILFIFSGPAFLACILSGTFGSSPPACYLHFCIFVFLFVFNLTIGRKILFRKKWAWWGGIATPIILFTLGNLSLYILSSSFPGGSTVTGLDVIIVTIIPFILLLLDRKNFWKIAT